MKYFFDQEFIEGHYKPLFGKRRHYIELVSIGIVAEDGREYYAISSDYNYFKANAWVTQNVIRPMFDEEVTEAVREQYEIFTFEQTEFLHLSNFHRYVGKPNKQIAAEILEFIGNDVPEFWAYFADYDWVLLNSLFGDMSKKPANFPYYCRDLKQTLDERAERNAKIFGGTVNDALAEIQRHVAYPKQQNEHNALWDARFNKDLYIFLQQL